MNELWKTVKDYEGKYHVSSIGRVKSTIKGGEKILKPRTAPNGYLHVAFYKTSRVTCHRVHRLVAMAFIPNPNELPQINHIDGNKLNNLAENLEWCNARYNQLHAIALGLVTYDVGEAHHMTPFKNEDIFAIREAYKNGDSQQRIADRYGVSQTSIHAIVVRKTWVHI